LKGGHTVLSTTLAVLAPVLNILGFVLYHRSIFRKGSNPNVASWGTWALVTILNFTSYQEMSKDWAKSAMPTIGSVLCISTFVVALIKGELKRLNVFDSTALCLGVAAGIWWWQSQSATYGNLLLQLSLHIGFVPTIRNVWSEPEKEDALPWFVWTGAFALSCLVTILRWKQASDFAYPVGMLVAHALVGCLALRHRK
jgi:hypothetical protein